MEAFITSGQSRKWLWLAMGAGLLIFSLSLSLLMLPYTRIIEDTSSEDLTCLHVPFTQERAARIIDDYDAGARAAARSLHFPGDTLFPIGYALLYGGLVGLIAGKQQGTWLKIGVIVVLFPVAAMVFDWIENIFIVQMIDIASQNSTAAIPTWMPLLSGISGSLKYVLLSVLTPIYGLTAIVKSIFERDDGLGLGILSLYLIAAMLLAFNFYRLVTDVLPCLL